MTLVKSAKITKDIVASLLLISLQPMPSTSCPAYAGNVAILLLPDINVGNIPQTRMVEPFWHSLDLQCNGINLSNSCCLLYLVLSSSVRNV